MSLIDEPEILNASRAFTEAQAYLRAQGVLETRLEHTRIVLTDWYDTATSPYEGYFALIKSGGDLEDLVGETLVVSYGSQSVAVYCLGGADILSEIALSRRAFMELKDLASDPIQAIVKVLVVA